jgi:hypothetical protein
MAQIYNPSYLGDRDQEGQDQPGQKVSKTPSQPTSWAWWHMLAIPATWNAEAGGSWC